MNNNPTYQQPLCSPCATCDESNTTTTRKRDENETRTTASDTVRCVPQLRFPEFQNAGEWKTVELGAIVEYENGVAHEQDIDVNGKYVLVNSKYISSNGQIEKRTDTPRCLAQKGDILMVLSDLPNGRALAKCFYVQENGKYTVNQRICKLRPRGVHSKFLYYLLDRNGYLLSFDDGVKQTNLKKDEVLRCPLIVPKTIEEQEYIADSLDAINSIILSAERTIGQLKSHKNALLQKLFPQRGKTIPEFRFPEFLVAGEWEEKTFGDCLDYEQPQNYIVSSENYKRSGVPVLTAGKTFVLGYTDENYGIYTDLPVIIFDDFTTACQYVDFAFKVKSSAIKMLHTKKGYDLKFMYETIQRYIFEPKVHQRHWIGIFSKFKILVPPSIREQQKIADSLLSIDNDIFATTQKLELLQQQKKALLQQLFVK